MPAGAVGVFRDHAMGDWVKARKNMRELPVVERARAHGEAEALRVGGRTFTYAELLELSGGVAAGLLAALGTKDLAEAPVAVLATPGAGYVASQWGVWRAGGMFLPLGLSATPAEWEYALTDAGTTVVLVTDDQRETIEPLCRRLGVAVLVAEAPGVKVADGITLPEVETSRRAMMLHTSGTTSKPKGVVTTHDTLGAQVASLVQAWEWSEEDRIPLFLPLHHIHGIVNVLGCALWSGALVEVFGKFDARVVLGRVADGAYTLFMAVPTIYVKLLEMLEGEDPCRAAWLEGIRGLRLLVSGSAALPAGVFTRWRELTGQALLERYGMTEIGMALANPLRGERRAGAVGMPLPGVEARLVSEEGAVVAGLGEPGEIQVRGATVFREYWGQPEATAASFEGEWFRTGDMAVIEDGYYRILGRRSVDIIKSGGYKLGALEIEAVLLDHPAVREVAVVGLPDGTWGEVVTAVVVTQAGATLDLEGLREWCRDRLSAYKMPRRLHLVDALPRNAMGKVTKPAVARMVGGA